MNLDLLPMLPAGLSGIVVVAMVLASIVVQVAFALAVGNDASSLRSQSRGPVFVGPAVWALATLFGGPMVAATYWAMHHSTFAAKRSDA